MINVIVKIIVASMIVLFCGVLYFIINAQPVPPHEPEDIDYGRWGHLEEKVTHDTITTPNGTILLDIHRNYGIPRFATGFISINVGDSTIYSLLDTIWYIPDSIIRSGGGINGPAMTDTSITVWWKEGLFSVKIMDILTGEIVFEETHIGQSKNLFDEPVEFFDLLDDTVNKTVIGSLELPGGFSFKKSNNPGTTINYPNLPNGFYWLYLVNNLNNEICDMYRIKKNI